MLLGGSRCSPCPTCPHICPCPGGGPSPFQPGPGANQVCVCACPRPRASLSFNIAHIPTHNLPKYLASPLFSRCAERRRSSVKANTLANSRSSSASEQEEVGWITNCVIKGSVSVELAGEFSSSRPFLQSARRLPCLEAPLSLHPC